MNISENILSWKRATDNNHLLILCLLIARSKNNTVKFSLRKLADESGISHRVIRTIVEHIVYDGIATQQSTQQSTQLTFCKYACNGREVTHILTQQPAQDTKGIIVNKNKYGSVSLTDEEYNKIGERVGMNNVPQVIEILDNYKKASGKKYKSDYHAILQWVIGRYEENLIKHERQTHSTKATSYEQANNDAFLKMINS